MLNSLHCIVINERNKVTVVTVSCVCLEILLLTEVSFSGNP